MWLCNRLLHCASSASTVINNDNDDSGSDSDSITSDIHIRGVELYHYPKEYTVVLCPAVMQIEESCRLSLSLSPSLRATTTTSLLSSTSSSIAKLRRFRKN